ncbi:CBS domain-containing protein [Lamprobacter modestohalophilus]|uniref:CBS domain-containing protein n=1 Tax=Lamprobacter modestohalophilus TaxID=1064514 RepID=UPI002ADEC16D|nr:CBS domain-containing protein [Lamprobacter modestohalophilus]MCF7978091.1 CBS domain-containing protein [Chromatiaceae bacterium]MCF8017136.1 CBS domain-containing protein [Chromatiaceae bacterium]MEA1051342.1 CBS domain-containing protein [Lamprobacter modestohalophilus]
MKETKTAKQAMSRGLVTLQPGMDVLEALRVLVEGRMSGAPVVDQIGNLVGILTERDCMKIALGAGYHSEDGGRVENFMTRSVVTIDANTPVTEVAERFANSNFRRLPVMEQGRLIGIISRRDVLKQLEAAWQPDRHRI